jgi:RNA polymerase sigma factor (sigma-70 family)
MNGKQLRGVVNHLRKAAGPGEAAGLPDAELLRRWVVGRDEAAFEVLLWRHAGLVLAVCRRVLRDAHEAEDAMQATFLALARKAASIGKREAVAAWLYRVAYRVALQTRARACKCPTGDDQALESVAAEPEDDVVWRDLRPVLDEEVSRLPARYRVPLVLRYLGGRTNEEVAAELGCPLGTVVSRLGRARERLRERLTRRGLTLSAGGLAAALAENAAPAAVRAVRIAATARAAVLLAAGEGAAGVVSGRVVVLAEAVLRSMAVTSPRLVMASVLVASLFAGVVGVLAHQAPGERPPVAKEQPNRKAAPPLTPFRLMPRTADDLAEVTGLNVYKYRLDLPKGQRFRILWEAFPKKGAPERWLWHHDFEKKEEGPLVLRVSFLRRDRKMQGVLLSQEKEAEFRLDCPGCHPPGLATIVSKPLADSPQDGQLLVVFESEKDDWFHARPGTTRLLVLLAKNPLGQRDLEKVYPRAELVLERLPKAD